MGLPGGTLRGAPRLENSEVAPVSGTTSWCRVVQVRENGVQLRITAQVMRIATKLQHVSISLKITPSAKFDFKYTQGADQSCYSAMAASMGLDAGVS